MTVLRTAKVLAFNRPMGTPAPEMPPLPSQSVMTGAQLHGNTSQRLSAFFGAGALIVSLLGFALTAYWHYSAESAARTDQHIHDLIAAQLRPLTAIANDDHINALIGAQLKPLSENVARIAQDVAFLKGQLHDVNVKLDKVKGLNPSLLARSNDPDKALAGIRASLEQAQDRRKTLSEPTLIEYRQKVLTLPSSAIDYWTTVAAIINYQSYLNQRNYLAPDPLQIAEPCPYVTKGTGGQHNLIQSPGIPFTRCVVDLDGTLNEVEGGVFRDSVIYWRGGPVTIKSATFINCRFIVDIKTEPARPEVLKKLLTSNQTYFILPAAG